MSAAPGFATHPDTDVISEGSILKRFAAVVLRTPRYALLVVNLSRDRRLSRGQRLGALGCLAYAVLPVDLVPGIIPVLGQLDDLAVLIGGLKLVLRTVEPAMGLEHLRRAGLTARDIDEDVATVRDTALSIGREWPRRVTRLLLSTRLLGRIKSDTRETPSQ